MSVGLRDTPTSDGQEVRDHARHLAGHLARLRLLLHRRALWLRARWRVDPLADPGGLAVGDGRADDLFAGEDPAAEAAFAFEDGEAAELTRRLVALEHSLAPGTGAPQAGLEHVVAAFALSDFERDVLLLAAAPDFDPAFARLCAYVNDDAALRFATPHLALCLLGSDGRSRRALDRTAPLRRFHLVELAEGPRDAWGLRPLRVDEGMLDHLTGNHRIDARVADILEPAAVTACDETTTELAGRAAAVAVAQLHRAQWPAIAVTGSRHAPKIGFARAVSAALGLELVTANPPTEEHTVGLMGREAALLGLAYHFDAGGDARRAGLADMLPRVEAPVVVSCDEMLDCARDLVHVDLPAAGPAVQEAIWHQALGPAVRLGDGDLARLVQQFDLDPETITRIAREAKRQAVLSTGDPAAVPRFDDLWSVCRARVRRRGKELGNPGSPRARWADIVLPDHLREQLTELADQAAQRSVVYERWGFAEHLQRGRAITAMFAGPSGTGKTMAAEVLASHLRLDLYRIDLAGVVDKYIGETEKNLRRVFDAAEDSGAVLFFDEADALFGKRTDVRDSHDRYANIEVDYLLQRMEAYRGIAILATNRKSLLDPAFLRRLRFVLDFPFPDARSRGRMWRQAFPDQAPLGDLDWDALTRLELTGGSIRTIAVNAAFLAARAGQEIGMVHLLRAARREYAKLDRLIDGADFESQAGP
jgi:hypothetical protein